MPGLGQGCPVLAPALDRQVTCFPASRILPRRRELSLSPFSDEETEAQRGR